MANTRSPRYPNISLAEAILRAKSIYEREHLSPLSPDVAAEAMGYGGINGTSLKTISSLRKYGLLEGRGNDVRISKDAQTLIIDERGSPDYDDAVRRCALNPELFSELKKQFPSVASERNISIYLEKRGFKPYGAAIAAKNFKETMELVSGESVAYADPAVVEKSHTAGATMHNKPPPEAARPASAVPTPSATSGFGLPRVVMNGDRLDIQASVNLEGLKALQEMLKKYEAILEMMSPSTFGVDPKEAAN
jgi:hypothetical protein